MNVIVCWMYINVKNDIRTHTHRERGRAGEENWENEKKLQKIDFQSFAIHSRRRYFFFPYVCVRVCEVVSALRSHHITKITVYILRHHAWTESIKKWGRSRRRRKSLKRDARAITLSIKHYKNTCSLSLLPSLSLSLLLALWASVYDRIYRVVQQYINCKTFSNSWMPVSMGAGNFLISL